MKLLQPQRFAANGRARHWLWGYGLAIGVFGATMAISIFLNYLSPNINPRVPIVFGLVAVAWFGGRGPGLLVSVLFWATATIFAPTMPDDATIPEAVFSYLSIIALYVFLVFVITGLQRARDTLKVRERHQAAVANFGHEALASIPLNELLPRAAEFAQTVLGVGFSAICELTPSRDMLCFTAGAGWNEDVTGFEFDFTSERSLAGRVLATGRPVVVTDLTKDDSFETSAVLARHDIRSGIAVKILNTDETYGVLGVFENQPRAFSRDDVNFLQSIANLISEAARRLKAEEDVREQRSWLQTTLASIGDAVIATDINGLIAFINPVAEGLTGWKRSEARGRPLAEVFRIVNEETGEMIGNPVERVLSTGAVVGLANHTELRAKNGRQIPIVDSAAPIKDGDEIKGVVLVFADATESRQAEAVSARLASIVASSADAIISKDLNGIITSWNKGAQQTFGYTAEEAIGQSVTMLIPPERADEEPGILERIRRGEAVDHYETVRRRKDGRLLDISLTVSPLFDSSGKITGASKIARDITERKAAERSRRESEMMHRLVEAQEAERHRIARDLHDHIGQKMTALRLQLEGLAERTSEDAGVVQAVDDLQRSAHDIDRDIGFLSWELRPTELENLGLVNALSSFVREWSLQYGIAAEFHASKIESGSSERLSESVETNLYRIVQEALHNILKHAEAERVSVLLQRRTNHIVLVIEDDGMGFEPEIDPTTPRPEALGLVGMQERAALMNGTLEIDTRQGRGTTILAQIPV